MSPLTRRMVGMLSLLFVIGVTIQLLVKTDHQSALLKSDPVMSAIEAFENNEIVFYEFWQTDIESDGQSLSYWRLAGEAEIPPTLLKTYTQRNKLGVSYHAGLTHTENNFTKPAEQWAYLYNLQLSRLLLRYGPKEN